MGKEIDKMCEIEEPNMDEKGEKAFNSLVIE